MDDVVEVLVMGVWLWDRYYAAQRRDPLPPIAAFEDEGYEFVDDSPPAVKVFAASDEEMWGFKVRGTDFQRVRLAFSEHLASRPDLYGEVTP